MSIAFDKLISDLQQNSFFAGFKYQKSESAFVKESNGRKLRIRLWHSRDYPISVIKIHPQYDLRFDILHRWYERFDFRTVKDQRTIFTLSFDECHLPDDISLSRDDAFYVDTDSVNYRVQLTQMQDRIVKSVTEIDNRFKTVKDLYDYLIVPVLKGDKALPATGSCWVFVDLALCKYVAPEVYPEFRHIVMSQVEQLYKKGEPNIERIHSNIDEMLDFLETANLEEEARRRKSNKVTEKPETARKKSIYSDREKFQKIDALSKPVEKKFNFKRSSWARWTTRDGYLFNADVSLNPKEDILFFELEVKPIYVDDLLWKIYKYKRELKPFSLRILGVDAVMSVDILKSQWRLDGDEGYAESSLTSALEHIYTIIEEAIRRFLKEHPNADTYYYYNERWTDQMLPILMLCHQHKYDAALSMLNEEISKGRNGGVVFYMPDDTQKTSFQFVKEYILNQQQSIIRKD
ncbi:MAG: hypothetical protein Q4C37_07105 [Bacteroidales bacterium]|nr:hypothetical protein [Bacteroidales bacterium]